MHIFKRIFNITLLNYLSYSLLFYLITQITYNQFLDETIFQSYWTGIILLLFILTTYIVKHMTSKELSISFFATVYMISLTLSFFSLKLEVIKNWALQHIDTITFVIILIFLLNLILGRGLEKGEIMDSSQDYQKKLFNLFYINTSKVHEIAMLIDNKIMKTVEREQVSEELLKNSSMFGVNGNGNWKADVGYERNESKKKRVYENFDVKTTKSIMLQKIYSNIKKSNEELSLGDLTIFENVELQQRNIDDTVMILNILQDSKIKNDPNEDLEVNLNKMMDKMLDDFTIDYTFSYNSQGHKREYILQIPYKDTENFENGYRHNDLQLGKLSIIGIYRGEIDFSKKESTSSKFLELVSQSYENELQNNNQMVMKRSNEIVTQSNAQIKFEHQKLNETYYLIDVVAIIQDLKINRGE